MKKWIKFLGVIIFMGLLYIGFLFFIDRHHSTGSFPTFSYDNTTLEVSVHDDESQLLKGIHATDKEDGDLSSQVFVETISSFDNQNCRTVTYGVFDSDDHLTRSQRTIKYVDYQAPQITLVKPLCFLYLKSNDEFLQCVEANSVVDGNITSKISISNAYYKDNQKVVEFQVTDSCGTTTKMELKATQFEKNTNVDIELSEYMIRVPQGTRINPRDYIQSVKISNMESKSLKSEISITNDYDPNKEGIYEFIYRISNADGDYGLTKLVVVVE